MKFINEYEMTKDRYVKWSTPVMWRLPIFYIYILIFVFSLGAFIYFTKTGVATKWRTLATFMMLISIYRGVLYRPMKADKQYRLTKQEVFHDGPWNCRVEVNEGGIRVFNNGKQSAFVKWDKVIGFEEANTFFDLKVQTESLNDQARLDKAGFTKGDPESFKQWMLETHPEIPYKVTDPRWNK